MPMGDTALCEKPLSSSDTVSGARRMLKYLHGVRGAGERGQQRGARRMSKYLNAVRVLHIGRGQERGCAGKGGLAESGGVRSDTDYG
jgi:hypothetical protein